MKKSLFDNVRITINVQEGFKINLKKLYLGSVDDNVRTNPGDSGGPAFIR